MWKIAKSSLEKQVSKIIYDLSFIDIGTYKQKKTTHTHTPKSAKLNEYVCGGMKAFINAEDANQTKSKKKNIHIKIITQMVRSEPEPLHAHLKMFVFFAAMGINDIKCETEETIRKNHIYILTNIIRFDNGQTRKI